uniref:Uncharacterized protein n=1 Tax=Musa acuminata subsp. malaccensis TaxID=214687 RepID=A0A804K6K8_MUSAM
MVLYKGCSFTVGGGSRSDDRVARSPFSPLSLVSRTERNADVKDRAESFPSEPRLPPRRIHRRKDRNGAHQPHLLPKDRHHRHRNRQPSDPSGRDGGDRFLVRRGQAYTHLEKELAGCICWKVRSR